jgi:hypothetical protein
MDEHARHRLDKEIKDLVNRNTTYDVLRSLVRVLESRHGSTSLTVELRRLTAVNDPNSGPVDSGV